MDFGKYIHQLLQENEIVIIPGFGAFISEYKPAEINDDSDEIKPPSKTISFNTQIRNNDGLLVGFVAEQKRVSHFDALKKIEKERENILYQLDSGEEFEIEEVGVLYSTDEGIAFRTSSEKDISLDSFGLEAASIVVEEKIEEPEPVVISTTESPEEPKQEDIAAQDTVKEMDEEDTDEPEEEIGIEEKTEEEQREEEPEKELEPVIPPPIIKGEPQEEKKKKRAWWWLLLILIPLIGISVFAFLQGYLDGTTDKKSDPQIQIEEVEQPTTAIDTVKADTLDVQKQDTIPVIDSSSAEEIKEDKPADMTETNKPQFYLVGGSFKEQENAETYLQELKAKGFSPFHLGKYGSFFVVGIGSYPTEDEAKKAKADYLAKNPGSGVWILER